MYAGTGEGYFREEIRGTGLPLRGGGIFVTRNGGGSWQQLPATDDAGLSLGQRSRARRQRHAAHLRGDAHRRLAIARTAARPGRGCSTVNVRGGCLDLALRPDRTEDVLFASCGSYEQATVYRFPRAADRSDVEVVLREPDMGRTSLAIAPSNPDVMYALAASNDDGPGGNYRQGLLAVYRPLAAATAGIVGSARHQQRPD